MTLFAVGILVFGAGGPAAAAPGDEIVGAGAGNGWEYPQTDEPETCPGQPPFFGEVAGDDFEFMLTGTFIGVNALGAQVAPYLGGVEMDISVAAHVISPAGTHTSCATVPVPGPVEITDVKVRDGSVVGRVHCDETGDPGTYTRVQSAVVFEFDLECTIDGNQAPFGTVTNVDTHVTLVGAMVPCSDPLTGTGNPACLTNLDAGSILAVTYTADSDLLA